MSTQSRPHFDGFKRILADDYLPDEIDKITGSKYNVSNDVFRRTAEDLIDTVDDDTVDRLSESAMEYAEDHEHRDKPLKQLHGERLSQKLIRHVGIDWVVKRLKHHM